MTKIIRTVQSRVLHSVYIHTEAQPFAQGLGRGMKGKKNFSSVHNDEKCCGLTFYLPTAYSKQFDVVNEHKEINYRDFSIFPGLPY